MDVTQNSSPPSGFPGVQINLEQTQSSPSADQDPVFDHGNTVSMAIGATTTDLITPPAGCKYLRVSFAADALVRTDGSAVTSGSGIAVYAATPEIIPVLPGVKVTAMGVSGATTGRATPMKVRG